MFSNYLKVTYLPSFTLGNNVYDVVLESFNETNFQEIKDSVFGISSFSNVYDTAQYLVDWADTNIEAILNCRRTP